MLPPPKSELSKFEAVCTVHQCVWDPRREGSVPQVLSGGLLTHWMTVLDLSLYVSGQSISNEVGYMPKKLKSPLLIITLQVVRMCDDTIQPSA